MGFSRQEYWSGVPLPSLITNLDNIFKSRDITLPTKVCLVKAMVFPVVMYGCESWTVKKTEHRRIDVFELWCWRRLLRVPWKHDPDAGIVTEESRTYLQKEGLPVMECKVRGQTYGE